MRKWNIALVTLFIFVLTGCSLFDRINDSLAYVNNATEYMNTANQFAEELPVMAEEAVTSSEARQKLLSELEAMKAEIVLFNELVVPQYAQDIHNQIMTYNNQLHTGITDYIADIKNGIYDLSLLQETGIIATINQVVELRELLNQLNS
ncbi:DUF6376 family protein [Paenibacillus abyssi]|uniref:Lipoprotein n=1 Tax=Paenibacillus abyssi TaxID=1340531 RepID=A0A917D5J3_9BACL|nr:DUF6376 family protein [Paenibacillus abyssi]GGG11497.1 hypothetical protein GCM10010916_30420 [Paenibacillus abyssi]